LAIYETIVGKNHIYKKKINPTSKLESQPLKLKSLWDKFRETHTDS